MTDPDPKREHSDLEPHDELEELHELDELEEHEPAPSSSQATPPATPKSPSSGATGGPAATPRSSAERPASPAASAAQTSSAQSAAAQPAAAQPAAGQPAAGQPSADRPGSARPGAPQTAKPAEGATAGARSGGAASARRKGGGTESSGGPPVGADGKRELEQAPMLLRKAAVIVLAGSVLPWAAPDPDWLVTIGKALLFLAVWVYYQSHVIKHGGQAPGPLQSLGGKNPKVLWGVAGLLVVLGFVPWSDHRLLAALTEKGILLLAGFTFVHIYDYERGGKFNPIYPLMFLAPAVAGLFAIIGVFATNPIGGIGALAICAGGMLACYTMFVALKQAKAEGDRKRAVALEARRSARSQSGGGSAKRAARGS